EVRDGRLNDLRAELDEARDLVDQMREQVQDADNLIDTWIDAFEMTQNDSGAWDVGEAWRQLVDTHETLRDKHHKLIREWNRFVGQYNATVAPRNRGRPIEASR